MDGEVADNGHVSSAVGEITRVETAAVLQLGARGDAHDAGGVAQAQLAGKTPVVHPETPTFI